MSGNIHDTDVSTIKKQIDELIAELQTLKDAQDPKHDDEHETISEWTETLQRKYKQLYGTSSTLFKFIVTNYGSSNFNEKFFNQTIDMMLKKIASIQSSQITQEDASANVGTHLAHKFVPQLNQK